MSKQSTPLPIQLEVSPTEIFISAEQELSEEAKAALDYISQDGMGITNLKELSSMGYVIEHSPYSSGTNIIRYSGYLAQEDWGRDVEFKRPDGRPHDIQLDNPQAD